MRVTQAKKEKTGAYSPVDFNSEVGQLCPHSLCSDLHLLWIFHEISVALKHNYQPLRMLKFEIPKMVGGLCCCPHECCYGVTPGLSHGILGSESSQRPLWLILEDEEWLTSSTSSTYTMHSPWSQEHAMPQVASGLCLKGKQKINCQRELNYILIWRMGFRAPIRVWEQNSRLNYLAECTTDYLILI